MRFTPTRLLPAVLGIALGAPLPAAEETNADTDVSDSALRIRGVFDAALPRTERKNSLRLIFHPHFGDLNRRDHLRIPLGLRYGLSDNWEVMGEVEGYVSHGLKGVAFGENLGFSQAHLGTKYRLGDRGLPGWDTAVGFDYSRPLGAPPLDVTDGLEHMSPFVTFARPWARNPDVRLFWGLGASLVNKTSVAGQLQKNQLGDDTANFSAGFVWHQGLYHYTLEAAWQTTDGIGGEQRGNVFTLRPAVVYELPPRFTPGGNGQWLLGLGLHGSHGPDGFDLGVAAKVRVNFDFKRLLGRSRRP